MYQNKQIIILGAILSIIFTLYSCNNSKKISKREQNLLLQSDSGFVINMDSLETLNDLLLYLDDTYCVNKKQLWPIIYLDLNTHKVVSKPNRNTIKVGIEPEPCIDAEIQYDPTMILEIVKDGHNTTIEREFTEIDSIPKYVKKQLLSFGDDSNYAIGALANGIWICTKKNDKLSSLYPYIYESVIGFLESANKYSYIAYAKPMEKLSDEEYKELAHEFTFHLSFKYTDEEASVKLDYPQY